MANPVMLPSHDMLGKKRKLDALEASSAPPTSSTTTTNIDMTFTRMTTETNTTKTMTNTTTQPNKLRRLQRQPLEENFDYIALQSSLSLLQARLDQIGNEIKELNAFKKCIKESSSVKEAANLVTTHSDYLKEINYKGSFIKCPVIAWEREYGIEMDVLLETCASHDFVECYEQVNEQYEIIKRDKLFGC
ncbi:hypothetical protein BON22_3282 [Cyberlindnera fabianii]|nr:hypothetical protein BON22_3282 [Cyberlindnera fabianii]